MKLTKEEMRLIYSALHSTLVCLPVHQDHIRKLKTLIAKFKELINEET